VVVGRGQRAAARAIVGKAERDCFVSASTTAEIAVDWEIAEPAV
jgi:organic hydroperoxide reductase OsmC/OhrA